MAILILSPAVLPRLAGEYPKAAVPPLEVTDDRDSYDTSQGDGLWIRPFLQFLEKIVSERCHQAGFHFSDDYRLDESLLAEIPLRHVQALVIEFTNAHYESWRDEDTSLPDYDDVHTNCRDFCDSCDLGWHEVHGEYDGPRAEDVEDDEDETAPELDEAQRQARRQRNQERQRERNRREQAQEDAEEEAIDREFTCDSDCDGFLDRVDRCYRDEFDPNLSALRGRWGTFLDERGENNFPPLHQPAP